MYTAIASQVQDVVRAASVRRIYEHERALGAFGSKDITQPGNQMAADYIHASLTSFGYTPEYQYFEAARGAGRSGIRTANVIATLRGTVHPELEYLVSSHYDSVAAGPGADDNTSGTSALLEAARILRGRPMPATIKFLWFTGEEAGLLGSREYVRQATARGDKVLGALNNDMVGFADDSRLDDTIRYSNPGLRDLQHAAAFQFTNLVTYDARYYQNTDAAAFFDAYGDVVAGIGSYPILGNPHYHTSHDTIDTVSFPLVTEVAKATTASIMLMASSPSRLKEVTATVKGTSAEVSWAPSPEKDVTAYLVRAWVNGQPRDTRVNGPRATIAGLRAGDAVWVKGVNQRGMEGWDWQRAVVK
jgi:Zn-dependent M28 family amino/carboxypeptidase